MGVISSGTGLISGLPIQQIVDQLIAIEARPISVLQQRVQQVQAQRTALMDINARLLALKSVATALKRSSLYESVKASSSNPSVVTASAQAGARPGSFTFRVVSLVATHQIISRGFADRDGSGVGSGTVSIEVGNGHLDPATPLDFLNGQEGVRRGIVRITDRTGATADIDLTTAVTVREVLEAINTATQISVTASVQGDAIVLTDTSGGTGTLRVADVTGHAAEDLGIAGSASGSVLTGSDVMNLADATPLSSLNDGNGVRRNEAGDDFTITTRSGQSFGVSLADLLTEQTALGMLNNGRGVVLGEVRLTNRRGQEEVIDLAGASNVGEVLDRLNGNGIGLSFRIERDHLLVEDTFSGDIPEEDRTDLRIEDVSGRAARDLGIAGSTSETRLTGASIYSIRTVGDVLRAINLDPENTGLVQATISDDGNGLVLTDLTSGGGSLIVTPVTAGDETSRAADDLGLAGEAPDGVLTTRRLVAGLNSVLLRSLNGGRGITQAGSIRLTARTGEQFVVDVSTAQTLQEVLDAINAIRDANDQPVFRASMSASRLGVVVEDLTGGGGALVIEDVDGTVAADLGLAGTSESGRLGGVNLQRQYLSEATLLSSLNGGRGIAPGQFRITDSTGASAIVDLTQGDEVTLGDVIQEINSRPLGIVARINDTGDGIVIEDTAGGGGRLKIEDVGGTTARDLNIAGEAREGENFIDGSYEIRVEIGSADTLDDIAAAITEAGNGRVQAAVINDGSQTNPYRLSVTSGTSGSVGRLFFDAGALALQMDTLVAARDAVLLLGEEDADAPVVITSSSNTITDLLDKVTLNLLAPSEEPVTVTIDRDPGVAAEQIRNLVDKFNAVIDRIRSLTSFDPETQTRGVLLGDATVEAVRTRLYDALLDPVTGATGTLDRAAQVGISITSNGRLELDEQRLNEILESNPEDVAALFSEDGGGLAVRLEEALNALTDTFDGLLTRRDQALEDRQQLFQERIDAMSELLDRKRERLLNEFQAMERSLALLQAQQSALSGLILLPALPGLGLGSVV